MRVRILVAHNDFRAGEVVDVEDTPYVAALVTKGWVVAVDAPAEQPAAVPAAAVDPTDPDDPDD